LSTLIGQQFAYAHGRMGVLRHVLLTQPDVDRLLGAHSLREVEKILTELKLTDIIDQGISEGHAIVEAVAAWMRREVETMSHPPARPVFHILWLQEDAPLLSYLLKQYHKLTAETSAPASSGMSAYDHDTLTALVSNGDQGMLPSHLTEFVERMKAMDDVNPRFIDQAVARYVTALQVRLARVSGSKAIRMYVAHQIDLQNIRTALRLRDEEVKESLPYILEGGTIAPAGLAGSMEEMVAAVSRSPLAMHLPDDLEGTMSDAIAFEHAAAHIIARDIADMWNVPLSIEPLFAFAAITLSQLKLIRTILIAKSNEIAPQEAKRMLPPFIPASLYAV